MGAYFLHWNKQLGSRGGRLTIRRWCRIIATSGADRLASLRIVSTHDNHVRPSFLKRFHAVAADFRAADIQSL